VKVIGFFFKLFLRSIRGNAIANKNSRVQQLPQD